MTVARSWSQPLPAKPLASPSLGNASVTTSPSTASTLALESKIQATFRMSRIDSSMSAHRPRRVAASSVPVAPLALGPPPPLPVPGSRCGGAWRAGRVLTGSGRRPVGLGWRPLPLSRLGVGVGPGGTTFGLGVGPGGATFGGRSRPRRAPRTAGRAPSAALARAGRAGLRGRPRRAGPRGRPELAPPLPPTMWQAAAPGRTSARAAAGARRAAHLDQAGVDRLGRPRRARSRPIRPAWSRIRASWSSAHRAARIARRPAPPEHDQVAQPVEQVHRRTGAGSCPPPSRDRPRGRPRRRRQPRSASTISSSNASSV